jgi:hypothetical protein
MSFSEQRTWRDRLLWAPRRLRLRLVWWRLQALGWLARLLWKRGRLVDFGSGGTLVTLHGRDCVMPHGDASGVAKILGAKR